MGTSTAPTYVRRKTALRQAQSRALAPPVLPNKRYESDATDLPLGELVSRRVPASPNTKRLLVASPRWRNETSAWSNLFEMWLRHHRHRGGHDDAVIGRCVRPTTAAVRQVKLYVEVEAIERFHRITRLRQEKG